MDDADFQSANGLEDELSLPKATVIKLVQEVIPPEVVVSKESLNLLIECCIEFIHLISSESNEICEKDAKKTIVPEHVVSALKSLGFEQYVDEVNAVMVDLREQAKCKERKTSKFEESGLSVEELQLQQEELFKKARERMQEHNVVSDSPDKNMNNDA